MQKVKKIHLYFVPHQGSHSLNSSFFRLCGREPDVVRARVDSFPFRFSHNGFNYIRAKGDNIKGLQTFYSFSEQRASELELPTDTFRLFYVREPVDYVMEAYRSSGLDSLEEFLSIFSPKEMMPQLYMFSKNLLPEWALGEIDHRCDFVFFHERFEEYLKALSEIVGTELVYTSAPEIVKPEKSDLRLLRQKLGPEIEMVRELKRKHGLLSVSCIGRRSWKS